MLDIPYNVVNRLQCAIPLMQYTLFSVFIFMNTVSAVDEYHHQQGQSAAIIGGGSGQWLNVQDAFQLAEDMYLSISPWSKLVDVDGPLNTSAINEMILGVRSAANISNESWNKNKQNIGEVCYDTTVAPICLFHNPHRVRRLRRRKWSAQKERWGLVPHTGNNNVSHLLPDYIDITNAKEFDPAAFLKSLSGRTIWLVGDSTVRYNYLTLICYLSYHVDKTGGHVDSYFENYMKAVTFFSEFGVTIKYQRVNAIERPNEFGMLINQLGINIEEDFIMLNFGAHAESEADLRRDLDALADGLEVMRQQGQVPKHLFWRETWPAHFDTPSGIYNSWGSRPSHHHPNLSCTPHHSSSSSSSSSSEKATTKDWRIGQAENFWNLREFFVQPPNNHKVIQLHDALNSQWDAHMDFGDSFQGDAAPPPDCLHFCPETSIQSYMLSEIVSYFTAEINTMKV